MRRAGLVISALALALLQACATASGRLYGHYVAHDAGYDSFTPPVTLDLTRPNHYRFCNGARCATGKFSLFHLSDPKDGRITFHGPSVEDFSLQLSRSTFGESEADRQRGRLNVIELDYRIGLLGAEITLGAGDAAFVKR